MSSKNVALVLSSGGARGIAHIGVIEKLLEMGFNISSISGTSIGSLIGGLFAAGHLDEYKDWVCSLGKGDVFSLMDFQIKSQGFIKGKRIFDKMEKWLSSYNIEDLPIPFTAVATDIFKREEIVINKGNLSDAIRASVAVPGFIAPHFYQDRWLFDGGVVNPMPINRVKRNEGDIVVAVDLNAFVGNEKTITPKESMDSQITNTRLVEMMQWFQNSFTMPKENKNKLDVSYVSLMTQMFDMMQEQISKYTVTESQPDVHIEIPRDICSTFEFYRSEEMIEYGRQKAEKILSTLNY